MKMLVFLFAFLIQVSYQSANQSTCSLSSIECSQTTEQEKPVASEPLITWGENSIVVSYIISFALLTESQVFSIYSKIVPPYNFILFYVLLLVLSYKLLRLSGPKSIVNVHNITLTEESQSFIKDYIGQKHQEILDLLGTSSVNASWMESIDKLSVALKEIKKSQEEFQEEIALSHREIYEELKFITLSEPPIYNIIAPVSEFEKFPYMSNKDRKTKTDGNFLVPPEHSIDSSDSYLPDEESDTPKELLSVPGLFVESSAAAPFKIPQTKMPPIN